MYCGKACTPVLGEQIIIEKNRITLREENVLKMVRICVGVLPSKKELLRECKELYWCVLSGQSLLGETVKLLSVPGDRVRGKVMGEWDHDMLSSSCGCSAALKQ